MRLACGVVAIKDERTGEWEFKYVGGGALDCINEAYMVETGKGQSKQVRVSIPRYTHTRNLVFATTDQAFSFINSFIVHN